jgi:hypothetical protein
MSWIVGAKLAFHRRSVDIHFCWLPGASATSGEIQKAASEFADTAPHWEPESEHDMSFLQTKRSPG